MYNESYEDYIRSILGYPNYNNNNYENSYNYNNMRDNNFEYNKLLEDCYPEIYRIVYPMISKACIDNTKQITSELIDDMTNEIYSALEIEEEIESNINLKNELKSTGNRNTFSINKTEKIKENRGENRQFRNRTLQDLIRILIIRELLGRPGGFPGNRPPSRPPRPPMRPPFPGGPGQGPRLPIMPRDYQDFNSNIYEM